MRAHTYIGGEFSQNNNQQHSAS